MFDLIVFPLSLDTGREQYELPGLLVVSAPRKAARMRSQDQLVLYCKLHSIASSSNPAAPSGAAITPQQLKEILTRLADTYFTFSGSITAGLRVVAARLNDFLLNRNLKSAQEGQTVGRLNMAVLHGDRLVIGHVGATHSFILSKSDVQHFDDSQAGRGLGLSRQMMPRFYQETLEAGDLFVLCADPPASWNAKTLANSPQLSFDHLRRRLTGEAGEELQAGIVRFQAGKGQISYWRPGGAAPSTGKPAGESRQPARHGIFTGRGRKKESAGLHKAARPADLQALQEPPLQTEPAVGTPAAAGPVGIGGGALEAEPGEMGSGLELETNVPVSNEEVAFAVPELKDTVPAAQPGETTAVPEDEAATLAQEQTAFGQSAFPGETEPALEGEQRVVPVVSPARPESITQRTESPRLSTETVSGSPARPVGQARRGSQTEGYEPAARSQRGKRAPVERRAARKPGALQTGLAAIGGKTRLALRGTGLALTRAGGWITRGLTRAIPRQVDAGGRTIPFFNLTSGQMMVIAIFIPLVVVAVATTVYVRSGLAEQFQQRLQKAQQVAAQAAQLKEPAQQREGWKQAYALLLDAEKYGESDQSQALQKQIVAALDDLEGYVRLSFQPAVRGDLGLNVNITDIVTTLNDVYLLDSSQGRILRLQRMVSGYELDPKFNCGPGTAGTIIINPLIDLAAMPTNNEMHSTVMGIDAGGNLVYCAPNLTGFDSRPLALPDQGWGKIAGITLSGNILYVLDPKGNAVYRYDGTDGVFADPPHLYFDNIIPKMNDVVDLAVDQEFLYLLHEDGRMTICESSGFVFAATKCTDPSPYGDPRPGNDPAPLILPGTKFSQIQTTEPPDPSLFALDSVNKAIYHLSLRRLNLQRQYRQTLDSNFPFPNQPATAFAIAPNRRLLIAFGNELFFAALP